MSIVFDGLMLLLGLVLCFVGCALLALSQQRNWRTVTGDKKANPPNVAALGWMFVSAALIPCVLRDGGSFAALLWPLLFAAGAMVVAMTLAYRPRWLLPLARLNRLSR